MLEYSSPAKINLFFRVLHKRPDGYHEIASLFQAIDLCDRLFISFSPHDILTCTNKAIACDSSNLIAKAIATFRKGVSFPEKIHVHVEKRIPIQAGLGGGSSNAATTLWALNALLGHPKTVPELIQMGASIGSDVPFFFSSGTAYCTGRGEIMEPFCLPKPCSGWLAKPNFGLSTPEVYKHTIIAEFETKDPLQALYNYPVFFNDLEIPAFRLEPRLHSIKQALHASFAHVAMTGSGTAFFCFEGMPQEIEGVTFYPFTAMNRQTCWYHLPQR